MTVTSKSNLARRSFLRLDKAKMGTLWLTPTQSKLVQLKADRNAVEVEALAQSGLRPNLHRQSGPEFISLDWPQIRGSAAALTWAWAG